MAFSAVDHAKLGELVVSVLSGKAGLMPGDLNDETLDYLVVEAVGIVVGKTKISESPLVKLVSLLLMNGAPDFASEIGDIEDTHDKACLRYVFYMILELFRRRDIISTEFKPEIEDIMVGGGEMVLTILPRKAAMASKEA